MAMTLEQKLRSGHVRRWHIVAVSREQTVADHMHRVGVIAEEILRILGLFDWNFNITLNVMRWAAIHDRHEYLLGDLPTPGKDAIRYHGTHECPDPVGSASARIDPEAEELRECIEEGGDMPLAGRIVKYADLLEAMNYVGIFGCGSHAREVWAGLQQAALQAATKIIDGEGLAGDRCGQLFALIDNLKEGGQWK